MSINAVIMQMNDHDDNHSIEFSFTFINNNIEVNEAIIKNDLMTSLLQNNIFNFNNIREHYINIHYLRFYAFNLKSS